LNPEKKKKKHKNPGKKTCFVARGASAGCFQQKTTNPKKKKLVPHPTGTKTGEFFCIVARKKHRGKPGPKKKNQTQKKTQARKRAAGGERSNKKKKKGGVKTGEKFLWDFDFGGRTRAKFAHCCQNIGGAGRKVGPGGLFPGALFRQKLGP